MPCRVSSCWHSRSISCRETRRKMTTEKPDTSRVVPYRLINLLYRMSKTCEPHSHATNLHLKPPNRLQPFSPLGSLP